jgi:hypothetical protein
LPMVPGRCVALTTIPMEKRNTPRGNWVSISKDSNLRASRLGVTQVLLRVNRRGGFHLLLAVFDHAWGDGCRLVQFFKIGKSKPKFAP